MMNKDYVRTCIANMKKRLREMDDEVYAMKENLYALEESYLDEDEAYIDDLFSHYLRRD